MDLLIELAARTKLYGSKVLTYRVFMVSILVVMVLDRYLFLKYLHLLREVWLWLPLDSPTIPQERQSAGCLRKQIAEHDGCISEHLPSTGPARVNQDLPATRKFLQHALLYATGAVKYVSLLLRPHVYKIETRLLVAERGAFPRQISRCLCRK